MANQIDRDSREDQEWMARQAASAGVEMLTASEQAKLIERGEQQLGLRTVDRPKGRPRRMADEEALGMIRELMLGHTTATDMARRKGISYPTILRYFDRFKDAARPADECNEPAPTLRQIRRRGPQRNLPGIVTSEST